VAVLPDGSWVSIGADGKLRTWSAPPVDGYIDGGGVSAELRGLVNGYGTGESVRAMISAGYGQDQATATAPGAYTVAVVDRRTGAIAKTPGIGGMDSPVRPSGRPGVGVRFYPSATVRWDVKNKTGPELPLPPVAENQSLLAISADGRYVAVAGQTSSYVLDADAGAGATWTEHDYEQVVRPIGVDVDDGGHVTVLAADGTRIRDGGKPVSLMEAGEPLATGHVAADGTVVLVAADGEVFVGDDRGVAPRGRVDVDLDPIAVHISTDGTMAAIIGFQKTQIMDLDRGLVIHELAVTNDYRAVSDLAFDDDPTEGALIVRNDGAISRFDLVPPSAVGRYLRRHEPRKATRTETDVYGIEDA
jgi:hypothetical protein